MQNYINMKIYVNQNKEIVEEVRKALEKNNGYCPCKLEHLPENKCMCEDFRNQEKGECHCGLYIKEKE